MYREYTHMLYTPWNYMLLYIFESEWPFIYDNDYSHSFTQLVVS